MYTYHFLTALKSQIQTFNITTAGAINNDISDITIHTLY